MALTAPPADKCKTLKLPDHPTGLDLTNDGKLLAFSVRSGKGPLIRVINTKTGSSEGEYAADAKMGWGVGFVDGGKSLVYVVRDDESHHHSLCRVKVGASKPEVIEGWTMHDFRVASISRNRDGNLYAINGSKVQVRSARKHEVVQTFKNAERDENAATCFDSKGDKIWIYGTEHKSVIQYDVATGKELRNLEGPREFGQQVAVAPKDQYLVALGQLGKGIRIYDLSGKKEKRIEHDELDIYQWDDDWDGEAFAFSHEGSLAVFISTAIEGLQLPAWEGIDDPPEVVENGALMYHAASAYDAPTMAFGGLKSKSVLWFSLVKA